MATITPVATSTAGAAITFAAASGGGDTLLTTKDTKTTLHVRNGSGGSINVTLTGVIPCSQGSTHNKVIACAIGDTDIVIPAQCIDPTNNHVAIAYSSATSITVAATT